MNAQQLYEAGRLDEAVQALGSTLRADPANVRARTFLFELLLFGGEYDRASKHLDIIADSSQEAGMGALVYRSALHAERTRQEMFANGLVSAPPASTNLSGTLNGRRFSSLTDADPRLGARLEVYAAGQYTLLPFASLSEVHVQPPKRLRDLLWGSARIKAGPSLRDFEFGEVLVPAVSPMAWRHADPEVRLGRAIAWDTDANGVEIPVGPKMLLVDDELIPILEVRELLIDSADTKTQT